MNLHLATAILFGAFAWLLWWRALPPLLVKRSKLAAVTVWLHGTALAFFVTRKLELAMMDAPISWTLTAGDLCLVAAAVAQLARAKALGPFRWGQCPGDVERSQ